MLKYKVFENFISENECRELIEDAEQFLEKKGEREIISNNRQIIASTSLTYNELLKNSKNWENLHEKINSHQFYQECLKNFNLDPNQFELKNFFFKKDLSNIEKKYKNLVNRKFSYLKIGTLFKLLLFRTYKEILFKIKFLFKKKINLELLFDFSISQKGYKREIHRDSDSRIIVFLLYLNSFKNNGEGGDLNLHELINKDKKDIPARPKDENCRIVKTLCPKEGNLVLFLNNSAAFHSVSEMMGEEKRYFLYGSYTALNNKNPFIKNSADKLKTEFFLFH